MFDGITLGLIAVASWQAYSDADTRIGEEAAAVGALYRDVSSLPDPSRTELQANLRQYARQVIDIAWPQQRRGIVPRVEGNTLSSLEANLLRFEPVTEGQRVIYAETIRGFDRIAQLRGRRLQSVREGLPGPLWAVVLIGAFLTISVTWFFDLKSHSLHFWMTLILSALLGLLIYLLGALDNPFRGDVSVTPEPFEMVYQRRMLNEK